MRELIIGLACICFICFDVSAQAKVSFSGYMDADFWSDLEGSFYTNSELDMGLTVNFTKNVSANVYATVLSANSTSGRGAIPGGYGLPQERWVSVNFDGFDITYKNQLGTFSVGDLVYQFGAFNYYLYKRMSMITEERFTRGIQYEIEKGSYSQRVLTGVADIDESTGDIVSISRYNFSSDKSISVFYGIRGSVQTDFKTGSDVFIGGTYNGCIGDRISLKADFGYNNIGGKERKNVYTFLFEPVWTSGKFSSAFTLYSLIDPDSANEFTEPLFGIPDELLAYFEPAYKITDKAQIGLPLEYHGGELENKDDNSFWVVPTFYVYPSESVQWLIWGMITVPFQENISSENLGYGLGSEIIVSF